MSILCIADPLNFSSKVSDKVAINSNCEISAYNIFVDYFQSAQ